jgi:hypothetical protein
MIFCITYYLELHIALTLYYKHRFLPIKVISIVYSPYNLFIHLLVYNEVYHKMLYPSLIYIASDTKYHTRCNTPCMVFNVTYHLKIHIALALFFLFYKECKFLPSEANYVVCCPHNEPTLCCSITKPIVRDHCSLA